MSVSGSSEKGVRLTCMHRGASPSTFLPLPVMDENSAGTVWQAPCKEIVLVEVSIIIKHPELGRKVGI
jgi:hypothetical protein